MPKKSVDNRPEIIYCACGCGAIIPHKKYPSQQNYFVNTHQHKGSNNGNYKGGDLKSTCAVCLTEFTHRRSIKPVTCSKDSCYRKWQGMTTASRGNNRVAVKCFHCGKELKKFPSQVKERNYCNRFCLAAANPKTAHLNGNWQGGKWKFIKEQTMIRDDYRCTVCGFDFHVHVHHIVPLSEGGTNDFSNLITLCPNHHCMADLGIINVEGLIDVEWTPGIDIDPIPHANH